MIGHAPVVSKSKYLRIVSCRSAELEYIALSLRTQEGLRVRALIKDMCRVHAEKHLFEGTNKVQWDWKEMLDVMKG